MFFHLVSGQDTFYPDKSGSRSFLEKNSWENKKSSEIPSFSMI